MDCPPANWRHHGIGEGGQVVLVSIFQPYITKRIRTVSHAREEVYSSAENSLLTIGPEELLLLRLVVQFRRSFSGHSPTPPTSEPHARMSEEDSGLKKIILESGAQVRTCRAASIPFNFGRSMSRIIKAGFSSAALCTASDPSDASPTTCEFCRIASITDTSCRNCSESLTTRIRTDESPS